MNNMIIESEVISTSVVYGAKPLYNNGILSISRERDPAPWWKEFWWDYGQTVVDCVLAFIWGISVVIVLI